MKAIAVTPGTPNSIHLRDVEKPSVDDVTDGRGVLVKVLRVGVDGTDKEINAAEYGAAPEGDDYLVIGHENFGIVEEVGPNVPDTIRPGTYVVASVRRPGSSIYGKIGLQDFTTDAVYYERGINLLHGYLTEYYVEDSRFVFPLPQTLSDVGVLPEPLTVAEKGINHAYEIQRRLKVWEPRRAAILGSGTIGLLMALAARLRGLELTVLSLPRKPYRNADLVEELGGDLCQFRRADARGGERRARAVRPDHGRHRLQSDRLGGRRGTRQEWRPRPLEHHRGRSQIRDQLGQDQPKLRTRKQGDGRNGQRLAHRLPERRRRPHQGRGALSRLARPAADDADPRPRALRRDDPRADRGPRRDQGLRGGEWISMKAQAYPPIGDYALLSDCHSGALVSKDGSIDWCTFHRFEARPVFARLLDWGKGGFFRIAPTIDEYEVTRRYLPGTNVLETRFETPGGVITLTDCFAVKTGAGHPEHRLIRHVRCDQGEVRVKVKLEPRFDYGVTEPRLEQVADDLVVAYGGPDALVLQTDLGIGTAEITACEIAHM